MAASKTNTVVQASGTLTAGTPITSSVVTLTTYDFATVVALVTNGGTGPTLPAIVTIQISMDNTTFWNAYIFTAGITASTTYTFTQDLPAGIQYAKVNFASNTAQNVTVACHLSAGTW